MLPEIKKADLNPLICSRLLKLDLRSPVHEIRVGTEKTELSLNLNDSTAIVFRLPADRNYDSEELNSRIRYIADTAHHSPKRNKLIAEAITYFLQSRGVEPLFETKLAIPALVSDSDSNQFDRKLLNAVPLKIPALPVSFDSEPSAKDLQLSVAQMPNPNNHSSDNVRQKTINFGEPKNLNYRRRKKIFGLF